MSLRERVHTFLSRRIYSRPCIMVLSYLPLTWLRPMGRLFGRFCFRAAESRRGYGIQEMARIFGDSVAPDEIRRIVFRGFCLDWSYQFELMKLPRLNRKLIDRMFIFEGLDRLDAALERGRGVVLLTSHFGAWKFVAPVLAYRGYSVAQIVMKQRSYERAAPVKFIETGRSLRAPLKHLRGGGILSVAADGRHGTRWAPVAFLGTQTDFAAGPMLCAAEAGAVALPVFIVRGEDGRHRFIIEDPIDVPEGLYDEVDVAAQVQQYATVLDRYVREYPSHYVTNLYLHMAVARRGHSKPLLPHFKAGEGRPRR